jgi:type II secretory pathway pseudopilin PulG
MARMTGNLNHADYRSGEAGFSIIEIMVAAGLISVIALGVASMMVSFQKENRALSEKLESIELEQGLSRILADSATCGCLFDSPAWTTGTGEVPLTHLKQGCTTKNFLTVGAPLTSQSRLTVNSIKIKNISPLGTGNIIGDLEISLSGSAAPIKPITILGQSFVPDSTANPTKIAGCLGVAGASQICSSLGGTWTSSTCVMNRPPPPMTTADCVASYGSGWTFNGSACVPPSTPLNQPTAVGLWNGQLEVPTAALNALPMCPAGAYGASTDIISGIVTPGSYCIPINSKCRGNQNGGPFLPTLTCLPTAPQVNNGPSGA